MTEQELQTKYPKLFDIMNKDDYARTFMAPLLDGKMNVVEVYEIILRVILRKAEEQKQLVIQLMNEKGVSEK